MKAHGILVLFAAALCFGACSPRTGNVAAGKEPAPGQAPPAAEAPELEAALPGVAAELLAKSGMPKQTLAVGEFKDAEGRQTALSLYIAERLEKEFADRSAGAYKVLSRGNLQDLVAEWDLGMQGYVDDDAIVPAGKLLGVEALCVGKFVERGGKLFVQAKLIDTKDSQVLASAEAAVRLGDDLRELAVKAAVPAGASKGAGPAAGQGQELKVEVWSDKVEYRIGEKMRMYVKANQDCYLTLVDVGTSGQTTVIFPNHYNPSNAIKGGVTNVLPPESAGFEFEVGGPAGTERVRAIASKEPVVDLKDVVGSLSSERPFAAVEAPGVLTRDIHAVGKKAAKGRWSETVLKITVR